MAKLQNAPLSETASSGGVCFCCKRRGGGLGYVQFSRPVSRIISSCDSHILLLKKALIMNDKQFDEYEDAAIEDAGQDAGMYLDEIGKTDLSMMTEAEWKRFCRTMIMSYGRAMAQKLESHDDIPF